MDGMEVDKRLTVFVDAVLQFPLFISPFENVCLWDKTINRNIVINSVCYYLFTFLRAPTC